MKRLRRWRALAELQAPLGGYGLPNSLKVLQPATTRLIVIDKVRL